MRSEEIVGERRKICNNKAIVVVKTQYSQPSLAVFSFCDFLLQPLADINTENSLSASNPHYCDSVSDKISYPELVRNFYSPGDLAPVFTDRFSKSL
jgi:hypothetical protein